MYPHHPILLSLRFQSKDVAGYSFSSNNDTVFTKNRSFINKTRCKMMPFRKKDVYLPQNLRKSE